MCLQLCETIIRIRTNSAKAEFLRKRKIYFKWTSLSPREPPYTQVRNISLLYIMYFKVFKDGSNGQRVGRKGFRSTSESLGEVT